MSIIIRVLVRIIAILRKEFLKWIIERGGELIREIIDKIEDWYRS